MAAPSGVYRASFTGSPFFNLGVTDDMILLVASICRNNMFTPTLIRDEGHVPYFGHQYAYWPVRYSDNFRVLVKIPILGFLKPEYNQLSREIMKFEREMLLFLSNRGFRWSPRVIVHTMGTNNALGQPYMIESMLPGKRLAWTDTCPPAWMYREQVLRQLAHIMFDLALLGPRPQEPKPLATPQMFLEASMEKRTLDVIKGEPGLSIHGCFVLRALARKLLEGSKCEDYVYSHEALHPHNIFVDDNFNVTGIIEWGLVKYIPSRFAYRFPPFLQLPNKLLPPMPSNWCLYSREFIKVPAIMKFDRDYFIAGMQYEYATRASPDAVGHLSPQGWEMMCWDLKNCDWNHMILEAVRSSQVHQFMEKVGFLVACLPEFRDQWLQGIVNEDSFWEEAAWFFHRNRRYMHPWALGQRTYNLMALAVRNRLPWVFIDIVLKDAYGPAPPVVNHSLDLR